MTWSEEIRAIKFGISDGCEESGKSPSSEDEERAARRLSAPKFGLARRFRARLSSRSALQIRR